MEKYMNPASRNLLVFLLVFLGSILAPRSAEAQATLRASSAAGSVTATGLTELVGEVSFTVTAGTSVAGRLEVSYPVAFTNDASTGISVSGTGGMAGATVTVASAATSGIVIVNVPAGAVIGNTVTIKGVRYAPSGNSTYPITATLSTSGNFLTAGQGIVNVVIAAGTGFTLDAVPSPAFSIANGIIIIGPSNFIITEGYEGSFTSDVGQLGQTTPTQIIFRVIGLPDNVTLTFPASAVGASGATLTAVGPVVVTNLSAISQVVYEFAASVTSQFTLDRFTIVPVIGTTGQPGTGTTFIQAALGPIGAAVPSPSLPSTAIPRFAENFLPPLSSLPGAVLTLNFPTSSLATGQSISVSNLGSGGAALSFRANLTDGSVATSALNPVLTSRETRVFSIPQIFGTNVGTSSVASIQVESLNSRLVGTSFESAQGGRAATPAGGELQQFILPLSLSGTREATLTVINSGTAVANVSLRLRAASGQLISTLSRDVLSGTTFRTSLLSAFSVSAAAVPVNAYVEGNSTAPVRVSAFANPQGPVEDIAGLAPIGVRNYRHPFFVTGGGYTGVVSLVNAASFPLQVALTPIQTNGALFSGVNAITRLIAPFERTDIDLADFFPGNTSLRLGYLAVSVERGDSPNPFSTPLIVGAMRIRVSSASAIVPLFTDRQTDSFMNSVTENSQSYTGVAFMNDSSINVNVTLDVFSAAGTLVGSTTFVVPALNLRAQLIRELLPAAAGQDNALVRINTTLPIGIIGFRGAWNLNELLFLPQQQ